MFAFIVVQLVAIAWAQVSVPSFRAGRIVGTVTSDQIEDCSGMGASRKHPGILYVINDGYDGHPKVFALNASNAALVATLTINPAINNDWEDLAVGPCGADAQSSSCIYIADTGNDNRANHYLARNVIYKVAEPFVLQDQTVSPLNTMKFKWDDPEADTIMVDANAELFMISKALGGRGMIVHLPPSAWGQSSAVSVSSSDFLYTLTDHHDPLGGDIRGTEVLLQERENIFYWNVADGNFILALQTKGAVLPYNETGEYGEAICWSADGSKYYTLSDAANQDLYVYERL